MNAATVKHSHRLSRLHLGCGESLAQLFPATSVVQAKGAPRKPGRKSKLPKSEEKQ